MIPGIGAVLALQYMSSQISTYSSSTESSNKVSKKKLNPNAEAMFIEVSIVQMDGNVRPLTINASYILKMERSDMQPSKWKQELNRWQDVGERMAVTNITLWDGDRIAVLETPEYIMINN